ncbi:MAG: ATP-binding cassette domain-containing protein [Anaerolineales bacterium]|nr:ATP-binding cassette domain-containing protein [Anaerolineales bacterium]
MEQVAIQVHEAYKVFHKERRVSLRRGNGQDKPSSVTAVDCVSFQVQKGEIFGVLGPNGSGKSTLVRLIATLLLPDGGAVSVFGHDVVREAMAVQRLINRVSVEASFFKKLSPMENLSYAAHLYGLNSQQARARTLELLDRLGLERAETRRPVEEMSRGMQQKVAIARALLTRPAVLLLDEPTTGLDPRSKREVQTLVRELRDQDGTTILLTTHDMKEADSLCDRVAIMDKGRVVALDTPSRLKDQVPKTNGHTTTLEDVFLKLTGKKLVSTKEDGSRDP